MKKETDNKAEERLAQILTKIKGPEFRLTPQRLAIIKILASSDDHPSVDDVYRQIKYKFPTTSLATVYKTISMLKGHNEVLELGFPDGSNRYDGSKPYPHPHAICTKCKKIQDPVISSVDELSKEMQQKTGFTISHHRLDFFGICPECQGKN
jgi:Fur family transcriptional regulator, peroxide stress response regulator